MANQSRQILGALNLLMRFSRGRASLPWLLVLGSLLLGYVFARPVLERSLGVSLPSLASESGIEPIADSLPSEAPSSAPARRGSSQVPVVPQLKDLGREVYQSPAGLIYTRGSQHGHRLKHLMAHAKDQPQRPGQHGVFDSDDPSEVLQIVDEAYRQALVGQRTAVDQEGERKVYTVNLGRRIGYIGGQSGNRRGNPAARHVRLVVQGKNLITAFPVTP